MGAGISTIEYKTGGAIQYKTGGNILYVESDVALIGGLLLLFAGA